MVQQSSTGLDNGLTPNRRQAIIWTNADPTHWLINMALGGNDLTNSKLILTYNQKWEHNEEFFNNWCAAIYHVTFRGLLWTNQSLNSTKSIKCGVQSVLPDGLAPRGAWTSGHQQWWRSLCPCMNMHLAPAMTIFLGIIVLNLFRCIMYIVQCFTDTVSFVIVFASAHTYIFAYNPISHNIAVPICICLIFKSQEGFIHAPLCSPFP